MFLRDAGMRGRKELRVAPEDEGGKFPLRNGGILHRVLPPMQQARIVLARAALQYSDALQWPSFAAELRPCERGDQWVDPNRQSLRNPESQSKKIRALLSTGSAQPEIPLALPLPSPLQFQPCRSDPWDSLGPPLPELFLAFHEPSNNCPTLSRTGSHHPPNIPSSKCIAGLQPPLATSGEGISIIFFISHLLSKNLSTYTAYDEYAVYRETKGMANPALFPAVETILLHPSLSIKCAILTCKGMGRAHEMYFGHRRNRISRNAPLSVASGPGVFSPCFGSRYKFNSSARRPRHPIPGGFTSRRQRPQRNSQGCGRSRPCGGRWVGSKPTRILPQQYRNHRDAPRCHHETSSRPGAFRFDLFNGRAGTQKSHGKSRASVPLREKQSCGRGPRLSPCPRTPSHNLETSSSVRPGRQSIDPPHPEHSSRVHHPSKGKWSHILDSRTRLCCGDSQSLAGTPPQWINL